jgi:hypothetical protein
MRISGSEKERDGMGSNKGPQGSFQQVRLDEMVLVFGYVIAQRK